MPQKSTVDEKSFVSSANFTKKSTYIDTHQYSLSELAQTCLTAAHLIDIAEKELELFQSDRCKYGDLSADEFDSLQYLYEQAIEALNDEQASLCGGIEG